VLNIFGRDDWTKFTDYRGYEVNDEVIQWFWKCVRSWPPERKSRLLQFATGTSRIPVNGFKDLQGSDGPRRFTIEKAGDPNQLPKSHTCFNRIDLPPYKDYASLEHKLTLAVECVSLCIRLWEYLSLIYVTTERPSDLDRSRGRTFEQASVLYGCVISSIPPFLTELLPVNVFFFIVCPRFCDLISTPHLLYAKYSVFPQLHVV
jgi:HECT-domain (ubiquitin-transferase)